MGFLDNLLKKGAKNIINNLVDEATDRISDVIDDKIGDKLDKDKTVSSETKQTSAKADTRKEKFDDYDLGNCATKTALPVMTKVNRALKKLYPQCTVVGNVHPSTIGGKGMFRPYTYGLYLNNQPKAFIMITDHNKEVRRAFRWSKEEAEKNGITFINFLTQFPNTEEYIEKRLLENIKL